MILERRDNTMSKTKSIEETALDYFEGLGMTHIAYCQNWYDEWLEGTGLNGSWNRNFDKDLIAAIGYLFEVTNEPIAIDELRSVYAIKHQEDMLMQDYGPTL